MSVLFSPSKSMKIFAATNTQRLQELGQQRTQLQKEIEAQKQKAAEKKKAEAEEKKKQQELTAAITRLNSDINKTEEGIKQTNAKITSTDEAVKQQLLAIDQKEENITQKKTEVDEATTELYIELNEGNEILAALQSEDGEGISGPVNRAVALDALSEKLLRDAEDLEKERQDLLARKAELEAQKSNLETQKNQLAAYERALGTQKEHKGNLVLASKEAQQTYALEAKAAIEVSEKLKKQFSAVANEEAAIRRAASKRSAATAVRGTNPSILGFIWPTEGTITTNFGGKTPFQNFHTGTDIANAAGTSVVAAQAGTVTVVTKMCCSDFSGTVDKSYGYGNWIEIKHDNGYITRYAHLMEMLVSPGDKIERGKLIAYMGGGRSMAGAGWSTGPHLHFEVWDAEGPLDPLTVLP